MTDEEILYARIRVLRTEMIAYAETVQKRIEAIEAKYSPDQPRDDWGRWVDSGGRGDSGSSASSGGNETVGGYRVYNPSSDKIPGRDVVDKPLSKPLEVDKATRYLHNHVDHLENKPGGNCARYVRLALKEGGITVTPPPPPLGKKNLSQKIMAFHCKQLNLIGSPRTGYLALIRL